MGFLMISRYIHNNSSEREIYPKATGKKEVYNIILIHSNRFDYSASLLKVVRSIP